jgi:hypothetical protein
MPTAGDWKILGIEPGATYDEVRRAWRQRRDTFDGTALATYGLLLEEERKDLLTRLDQAYHAIVGEPPPQSRPEVHQEPVRSEQIPTPSGPEPDIATAPGAYLRHVRLSRGLTLERIARETRIRTTILDRIENQDPHGLPAPVYVRGFVVQVGRLLGIENPDEVAASLLRTLEQGEENRD